MEKLQEEDPSSKTLDPLSLATPPPNLLQNPNPQPHPSIPDDPRTGGDEKKDSGSNKPTNATVATLEAAVASGAAGDLEKKLKRAERFGVAVQLSEEEKRRTRADRFGTAAGAASTLQSTKNGGKLEEQKRKARAERFGLAVQSTVDEEAKKKARLERFGQKPKPNALDEEKMKARAARFSQTPIIPSTTNGKINTEVQKAVAATTTVEPNS